MTSSRYLRPSIVGLLSTGLLSTASATARADGSIVIDFVRHGEAGDNTVINTLVAGPHLTDAGRSRQPIWPWH